MKINMNFTDNGQTFPVQMQDNGRRLDASIGEYQVVGVPGADGAPGADGFSPIVDLTETDAGVDITVTDAEGVKTATVRNGRDGKDGQTGPQGPAGVAGPAGADGKPGQDGAPGKDGRDGYTPVKGKDYFDGQDGAPGQDGFSPVVAVQDISGGHRVTITDKDGAKVFDVMDGAGGGGGDSPAIIDVVELPETDIDEDSFYRRLSGQFYCDGTPQGDWTCYIVETLPSMGVPVTTDMVHVSLYYAVDTGSVSGYIPDALAGAVGVPAGWYPVEVLGQAFGLEWAGIISDASQDPIDGANRLLLKYDVYHYAQGWVNLSDNVGWRSPEGAGAEVFNSLTNKATGNHSHAEGDYTTASGESSHAEGYHTFASGNRSHAEGSDTTANGNHSHAEGSETVANGRSQHVEGEYNIIDSVSDPNDRGKYIHIAGNGTNGQSRSNAYTLDWSGNGWFAGSIKVGGTGQDDEAADSLVTRTELEAAVRNASGGSGGASVQSDWNQHDEAQPDFVKNRTHYEVPDIYDITWDGDMTGKPAMDLAPVGIEGAYLVKVSDRVYTKEELHGKFFVDSENAKSHIETGAFTDIAPGAFVEIGFSLCVIYSAHEFSDAVGIPAGYITNGTYFFCMPTDGFYIAAIYTKGYITKLDEKYLPDSALRMNIIEKTLICTLDGGWSTHSVNLLGSNETIDELNSRLASGIVSATLSVKSGTMIGTEKCNFVLSFSAGDFMGSCYVPGRDSEGIQFYKQIFIVIDPAARTISVAAKTVTI